MVAPILANRNAPSVVSSAASSSLYGQQAALSVFHSACSPQSPSAQQLHGVSQGAPGAAAVIQSPVMHQGVTVNVNSSFVPTVVQQPNQIPPLQIIQQLDFPGGPSLQVVVQLSEYQLQAMKTHLSGHSTQPMVVHANPVQMPIMQMPTALPSHLINHPSQTSSQPAVPSTSVAVATFNAIADQQPMLMYAPCGPPLNAAQNNSGSSAQLMNVTIPTLQSGTLNAVNGNKVPSLVVSPCTNHAVSAVTNNSVHTPLAFHSGPSAVMQHCHLNGGGGGAVIRIVGLGSAIPSSVALTAVQPSGSTSAPHMFSNSSRT